jgi:hypothetical protein
MFPAKDPCKIKPVLKEKVGDSVKTSAKDGEMTPVKQHWKFLAGSQLCKPTGEQKGKITKKNHTLGSDHTRKPRWISHDSSLPTNHQIGEW